MEHILWTEKYRPQKISDCILPSELEKAFIGIIKSENVPNLLLSGTAGVGKTTVAKALCNEIGASYLFINGSKDGNIDTLRTTIQQYSSSMSFNRKRKVVILDESDYLNCLEENEEVLVIENDKVVSKKLKDLPRGILFKVESFNLDTKQFEPNFAKIISESESMVYEVEFEDGSKILVTDDHPFIVEDSSGYLVEKTISDDILQENVIKKCELK